MNKAKIILFVTVVFYTFGCVKPEDNKPNNPVTPGVSNLWIVNEGLFNQNNSTLSLLNLNTKNITNDFFQAITGRRLGDTGNFIFKGLHLYTRWFKNWFF
jgi:hypothetical protein